MADPVKTSVQSGKKPAKDTSTQRYLPFSEIRDNCIIMKDGSSRMVLQVYSLNFNLKSVEEQDSILVSYQRFLNTLNFPIQIIVRSLKVDIESYINKLKMLAANQKNTLLQEQTYRYIDFLMNLIDLAQIMRKDFYIVVPYDEEGDQSVKKQDFIGIFQSFWKSLNQEVSVAEIRTNRRRIESLRKWNAERMSIVRTALESMGLKSEELKKDGIVKLLYNYYNPRVFTENGLKVDPEKLNIN